LNTVWTLIKKDLLRDARHPWGLIVFMIIPVLTALIMAMVFSPQTDIQKNVTIDLAVLDRDDDFLSHMLRSISGQGDTAENLRLHFVESQEQGIAMLEKRKASAFVVLPENLTVDLLDGKTTSLTLYKNPAQAILPQIVEEGLLVVSIGVSEALNLLKPQLKAIRDMIEADEMPEALQVAKVGSDAIVRLESVEPYLFPPLVQFETVDAAEYVESLQSQADESEGSGS